MVRDHRRDELSIADSGLSTGSGKEPSVRTANKPYSTRLSRRFGNMPGIVANMKIPIGAHSDRHVEHVEIVSGSPWRRRSC